MLFTIFSLSKLGFAKSFSKLNEKIVLAILCTALEPVLKIVITKKYEATQSYDGMFLSMKDSTDVKVLKIRDLTQKMY